MCVYVCVFVTVLLYVSVLITFNGLSLLCVCVWLCMCVFCQVYMMEKIEDTNTTNLPFVEFE